MPYSFMYDLTRLSKSVFRQIFESAYEAKVHTLLGTQAKRFVETFKIDQATGLNLAEAVELIEDIVEVQLANMLQRDDFENAQRKALLLPHCARSRMDKHCMADFDATIPSYKCQNCREDCPTSKAVRLGEEKGYDVYIIPGGACAEKILKDRAYGGVVGVACGAELKMALGLLDKLGIAGQGVFLTRNGCANTSVSLENLKKVL